MTENSQNTNEKERLLTDFPETSFEDWEIAATATLKGKPIEKLISKTYEGIEIQPLYTSESISSLNHTDTAFPGFFPFFRGNFAQSTENKGFELCHQVIGRTSEDVNAAMKYLATRDCTGFIIQPDMIADENDDVNKAASSKIGGVGMLTGDISNFEKAFRDIPLQSSKIYLKTVGEPLIVASLLGAYCKKHGIKTENLHGGFFNDPIGFAEHTGNLKKSDVLFKNLAGFIKQIKEVFPKFFSLSVCAGVYGKGGGNAVQQLGFALAKGCEYIRKLQENGLSVDVIASSMVFRFPVGSDFFMEIAKLRAARLLWANVVKAFGGSESAQKMKIQVFADETNRSSLDKYNNVLRNTVEMLAGIIGGASIIQSAEFDFDENLLNEQSTRLAINTLHILREECDLMQVTDPSGGSYYIEYLTDQVCSKSWELFQNVESLGGMMNALKQGFVQDSIAKTATERKKNMAFRKDVLVGVNKYANLKDELIFQHDDNIDQELNKDLQSLESPKDNERIDTLLSELQIYSKNEIRWAYEAAVNAFVEGAPVNQVIDAANCNAEMENIDPITKIRLADPFEILRLNSYSILNKTGSLPKFFLLNMGPVSQHKARADFSLDFLQVGGLEPINNFGFESTEAATTAFLESGANIGVICSTDETYPEIVPDLVQKIKMQKPGAIIILAGLPVDYVEQFKAAGVDEFIHTRADILQVLSNIQNIAGIK
jgi:methylmalonyl-CoA mutase